MLYFSANFVAGEWQMFLLAHRRWGTFREEERLRLSDRNSILMTQNPVRSANTSMEQFHCSSYCLRMTDKRQKVVKVKCKCDESLTKQSIWVEYSILQMKHLSSAGAHTQMNTTLFQNRPGETYNWTNLHLEPHDYRIYYVNIDLRHQYGISIAESQTFLLAKRPSMAMSEETRLPFARY